MMELNLEFTCMIESVQQFVQGILPLSDNRGCSFNSPN